MAKLNSFACLAAFGNTGYGACSLIPKYIIGAFITTDPNFIITQSDADDLSAFLKGKIEAPSKFERLYPTAIHTAFTNNSEEAVTETTGFGTPIVLRDGNYVFLFNYLQGGLCLHKSLRKFNGQRVFVYFVDADGVLFGYNVAEGLKPIPLIQFYVPKWAPSDSTASSTFQVQYTFLPVYFNERLGFLKDEDIDWSGLMGLQDLNPVPVGAQTATVLSVEVVDGCGGENLFDLYDTELAAQALWTVRNKTTGAVLPLTSVAANAGTKRFTITLASERTTAVTVTLAGVTELSAANIVGFEGGTAEIPAP